MSGYQHNLPQNIDLTPRKHHGYAVLLFIFGTLFPPLAVAARFGIGGDFWLNLLLTVCGYIPGHGHNFYIQNIRNNKNHRRTPKWVQRYGLVDTSEIRRKERKSQWANRYNDRLPESTLAGQPYEEGQEGASSLDNSTEDRVQAQRTGAGEYWRQEDESYYQSNNSSGSTGRWHYPANFEETTEFDSGSKKSKKKKKDKKDRWARTEDAYVASEERGKKKKKSKKNKQASSDTISIPSSRDSGTDFPEDPEGGLYSERNRRHSLEANGQQPARTGDDVFNHQF